MYEIILKIIFKKHLRFNLYFVFSKNEVWNSELTVKPLKLNVRLWEFVLKLVQTYLTEVKNSLVRDIKPPKLYENLCKLSK